MARLSISWLRPAALLALCGAYSLFVGTVSLSEALAALPALAGGVAIVITNYLHRHRPVAVKAPWMRLAGALAAALLRDTFAVGACLLRALGRPHTGRITVQPFAPGDASRTDAGRRATVILATSLAPNAYVVRVTAEALLLHQLTPVPDKTDRRWPL